MIRKKVRGTEALLLSLIAEGTDTIFGYLGGTIMPFYDDLYHYSDQINHILVRHEQGAVHAAEGYARSTGKAGVCIATAGPGATNFVTGIADAMLDSTPLICITAQVNADKLGTNFFQEADTIGITLPITKWSYQITGADEIPQVMAKAFYIARSGRPGPVVISVAKNAQVEMTDFAYDQAELLKDLVSKDKRAARDSPGGLRHQRCRKAVDNRRTGSYHFRSRKRIGGAGPPWQYPGSHHPFRNFLHSFRRSAVCGESGDARKYSAQ